MNEKMVGELVIVTDFMENCSKIMTDFLTDLYMLSTEDMVIDMIQRYSEERKRRKEQESGEYCCDAMNDPENRPRHKRPHRPVTEEEYENCVTNLAKITALKNYLSGKRSILKVYNDHIELYGKKFGLANMKPFDELCPINYARVRNFLENLVDITALECDESCEESDEEESTKDFKPSDFDVFRDMRDMVANELGNSSVCFVAHRLL